MRQLQIGRLNSSEYRRVTEDGQEYLVVPSPIARERVYDYSDQDLPNETEFLPKEELERAASSFDGTPINIEHPLVPSESSPTGVTFGSINDPDVLNRKVVGEFRSSGMEGPNDDVLVGQAWLQADTEIRSRLPRYATALQKIENGDPVSVSPGYDIDSAPKIDSSEYEGVRADGVQKGVDGDHVAMILSGTPRCTIEEGCAIGGPMEKLLRSSSNMPNPSSQPVLTDGGMRVDADPSDEATTKAPKEDQKKGSDTNKDGSASETTEADIDFSKKTEKALKNKAEEHKEKADGDDSTYSIPAGSRTLKKVYRRGAGAYSSSHRPGVSRGQWAMARVNAFLYLLRNGKPENPNYTSDEDLLPDDHPKSRSNANELYVNADSRLHKIPSWVDVNELEWRQNSVRKEARKPKFNGTSSDSWGDVSTGLDDFVSALDLKPGGNADSINSVDDLTPAQRSEIADHSLLGNPDAGTIREVKFFPVVNPSNGKLYEGALDAVIGGRGASADIGSSQLASARSRAYDLLESEFDRDVDSEKRDNVRLISNMESGDWVKWDGKVGKIINSEAGNEGEVLVAEFEVEDGEATQKGSPSTASVDDLESAEDPTKGADRSDGFVDRMAQNIAATVAVTMGRDDNQRAAAESAEGDADGTDHKNESEETDQNMSNEEELDISDEDEQRINTLVEDHDFDRENMVKLAGTDCLKGFHDMAERVNAEADEDDEDGDGGGEDDEDGEDDGDEDDESGENDEDRENVEVDVDTITQQVREELKSDEEFRSEVRADANEALSEREKEKRRTELKEDIVANSESPAVTMDTLTGDLDRLEEIHSDVMEDSEENRENSDGEEFTVDTDFGGMSPEGQRFDASVDEEGEVDLDLAPQSASERYNERSS